MAVVLIMFCSRNWTHHNFPCSGGCSHSSCIRCRQGTKPNSSVHDIVAGVEQHFKEQKQEPNQRPSTSSSLSSRKLKNKSGRKHLHGALSFETMVATVISPLEMDVAGVFQDVEEVIKGMIKQENTVYKRTDYLNHVLPSRLKDETIDGSWRQRIIEWMYGVVDHCNLRRDSVSVATYFLDLSAAKGLVLSRRDFQLVAMTSLMLSIKLYDSTLVKLDSMVKLGRGLFNEKDVILMESKMLQTLGWHVHPPTPVCFMRQMLRLLPPETTPISRYMIVELTRFISEISACLYKFVEFAPSSMALASILIAMERVDVANLPVWQRHQFVYNVQTVTHLDSLSPDVVRAQEELRLSLDNNVNLQELMRTIDAQCHVGHHRMQSKAKQPGTETTALHSPRDVASRVFR